MAGEEEEVKNSSIFTKLLMILSILFFLSISPIFAQERADFLILENPQIYTILNKYEQPIAESERELFILFSPLQIINTDEILGDQITTALKFRFHRNIFFLLKDDDGNYVGDNNNIYRQVFKSCEVIKDTIRIIKSRAVILAEKYPSKGNRIYLENGNIILRMFRYKDYYYVMHIGQKEGYGWCRLSSKDAWKTVKTIVKKEDYSLKPELQNRIISRIQSANKVYKQYFNHFNTITGQQKSVPQWRYSSNENMIHCSLTGPYKNTGQLEESTQYLVQDLENMLLGKPFKVQYQNREITIKIKK